MIDSWKGCYPSSWQGKIVPDAIAHPAKFSSKLIRRIYDHIRAEGWVQPGDVVIDPFGGVALGALDAMRLGLVWRGCELEPRFVDLGNANIDLWNNLYSRRMPGWSGEACLLNGDSRELAKVIGYANAAVSSPPYADSIKENEHGSGIDWEKVKEGGHNRTPAREAVARGYSASAVVSSPPYAEARIGSESGQEHCGRGDQYSALVSSPPFTDSEGQQTAGKFKDPEEFARIRSENYKSGKTKGHYASPEAILRSIKKNNDTGYSFTPGQLGAMKANGFDAAVSSPPFAAAQTGGGIAKVGYQNETARKGSEAHPFDLVGKRSYMPENQGTTSGNLANESTDDFWTAARQIVDQVYQVLAPGAHAVWVCKDFVKNKRIVPFCDQWRQLCEAAGFTTLHEHHALLVHATEHDFDGKEKRRESKSFFRRLAENKGSPRIDWEVVYCMVKPTSPERRDNVQH